MNYGLWEPTNEELIRAQMPHRKMVKWGLGFHGDKSMTKEQAQSIGDKYARDQTEKTGVQWVCTVGNYGSHYRINIASQFCRQEK